MPKPAGTHFGQRVVQLGALLLWVSSSSFSAAAVLTLEATDTGLYSADPERRFDAQSYVTGIQSAFGAETRGFFAFNLSDVPAGSTINSAYLLIENPYSLNEVGPNDPLTLNIYYLPGATSANMTSAYAGTNFPFIGSVLTPRHATYDVLPSDYGTTLHINLFASGIASLNDHIGDEWYYFGMKIVKADAEEPKPLQYVFGGTALGGAVQLVLDIDPGWVSTTTSSTSTTIPTTTVTTSTSTTSTTNTTTTSITSTTTTSVVPTTITTTTVASTSTTLPAAVCELLDGEKLLLKSHTGAKRRGIRLRSTDPDITLGSGNGSPDDPVLHGATVRVVATGGDAFDDTYQLAADRWVYHDAAGQNRGYKLRPTHPFRSITVQPGKGIGLVASGQGLGHTLRAQPDHVDVVLTLGARCYCLRFGGEVVFKADRKLLAKVAPAPTGCPPPATPGGASVD